MKKTFRIEDLCCANCAAKIEDAIRRLDGVTFASVNFLAERMTLEADDAIFEKIAKEAAKIARKIEPDCTVILE